MWLFLGFGSLVQLSQNLSFLWPNNVLTEAISSLGPGSYLADNLSLLYQLLFLSLILGTAGLMTLAVLPRIIPAQQSTSSWKTAFLSTFCLFVVDLLVINWGSTYLVVGMKGVTWQTWTSVAVPGGIALFFLQRESIIERATSQALKWARRSEEYLASDVTRYESTQKDEDKKEKKQRR
jgi:hypothetical protein